MDFLRSIGNALPEWLHPTKDANTTEETNDEEVELEPEEEDTSEDDHRCEYCDFSTDTERGLNIHSGRVHGQNDGEDEEEAEEENNEDSEPEEEVEDVEEEE